jgi:hypothetical protein
MKLLKRVQQHFTDSIELNAEILNTITPAIVLVPTLERGNEKNQ